MSYDQRGRPFGAPRGGEDGGGQKGSVRAARERMAQQRAQIDTSRIVGLPQRPNQLVSQYSAPPRPELSQQRGPARRREDDMVSPPPQWPLANDASSPGLPPRSPRRLQPPQQTVRPVSDDLPIQQLSPDYASPTYLQPPSPGYQRQSSQSDEMFSPSSYRSSRPLTTSSAASEASSLGSIPDFPVPQPPMPSIQQARRVPGLGPPPSSRRGPSSYYTQMSYVSPIAEESETRSDVMKSRHGSFASSNVFPTNNDYRDDDLFSDDDETITSDRGTISPTDPDDRRGLVKEASPALVRQASLGRRTKPSLMTIKSVDSMGDKKNGAMKGKSDLSSAYADKSRDPRDGMRTAFADVSSSSSESLNSFRNMKPIVGAGIASAALDQETRPATLAERAGMRRPPKLDMDAVRDAEARGSLTSLPDLIRRATRLAANLDRGKTASRLGLDFWEAGAPDKRGRQSGLSDMLAAFPPPGQDTPVRTGTPNVANNNRMSKWPSGGFDSRAGATDSAMSNEKSKRRRKCCGMPMWTFITLMIVLLFVIAAAVVIPVVLVVIPNQNKENRNTAQEGQNNGNNNNNNNSGTNPDEPARPAPTLPAGNNQCDGLITCQNSGIAILNADRTCNCVCINGFTGRSCTNNDATGCTTGSVPGTANNATMGTAISRLLGGAAADLNVPLNSTRVLSLFSQLSLSCAAQNALITFNGLASRSDVLYIRAADLKDDFEPTPSLPLLTFPDAARDVHEEKRQAVGAPGTPSPSPSRVATNINAAQPSATPTGPISSNSKALDFARVGVLFALQQAGNLDTAAKAQEAIQNLLTNNRNSNTAPSPINVGPFRLDLIQLTITYSNGTTIRASPSSTPAP